MNPFPPIEVTAEPTESRKCIRQTFEIGELFVLTFLNVLVKFFHDRLRLSPRHRRRLTLIRP